MPKFDVTAFGETMLRLSVASGARLTKFHQLDAHVGGAETNVLAALCSLDRRCGWVSGLPDNDLGRFVLRDLMAAKIDASAVVTIGDRVGTYYVEFATVPRPINVIYDRAGSGVTQLNRDGIDWEYLLDTRVLHLTGITAALSQGCYDIVKDACKRAREKGVTVCFDVNYRSKLWSPDTAKEKLTPILEDVDMLICGEGDAETVFHISGSEIEVLKGLQALSDATHVILTRSHQGSCTLLEGQLIEVAAKAADVIDRLGAGDAFAAGVIDGYLDGNIVLGMKRGSVLSALALTQRGDMVYTTRNELEALLASGSSTLSR